MLIPGLVPDRISDRGIFVSVAGRLLAGDTLYREVYDNKDPLFYYFVTLQLILGPWAEVAAEALLIASAAAAAYVLAASSASRFAAAAVSCIAVPIILTGAFYIPGYTELPGIVITLLAIAAAASERPLLAGLCLGALPFLKFAFLPVALAGIGPFLLLRLPFSALLRLALGSFLSMAGIASVLALRGELMPFLDTIKRNIAYAQGSLVGSKKGLAGISEHVRLVGVDRLLREVLPIALAVVLSATLLFRKWTSNQVALASAAACAATLLASLFVIFFAGFWSQHLQVLYIPAILAVIALALVFDSLAEGRRLRMLGLVFLAGFLLSGSPFPVQYAERIDSAYASYGALRELAPEARRLLALGSSGEYARFGTNDDWGHAAGLRGWKLICPRFHQYFFQTPSLLNEVFECASKAPALIISEHFEPNTVPSWNAFVARVEQLLKENYICDANTGLRVCKHRAPPETYESSYSATKTAIPAAPL